MTKAPILWGFSEDMPLCKYGWGCEPWQGFTLTRKQLREWKK